MVSTLGGRSTWQSLQELRDGASIGSGAPDGHAGAGRVEEGEVTGHVHGAQELAAADAQQRLRHGQHWLALVGDRGPSVAGRDTCRVNPCCLDL